MMAILLPIPGRVGSDGEPLHYRMLPFNEGDPAPHIEVETDKDGVREFFSMDGPFALIARTIEILPVRSGRVYPGKARIGGRRIIQVVGVGGLKLRRFNLKAENIAKSTAWDGQGFNVTGKSLRAWRSFADLAATIPLLHETAFAVEAKGWVAIGKSAIWQYVFGDSVVGASGQSSLVPCVFRRNRPPIPGNRPRNGFMRQVLSLPGTRTIEGKVEHIRIKASPNREIMLAVEAACERVNAHGFARNGRTIRLSVDRHRPANLERAKVPL